MPVFFCCFFNTYTDIHDIKGSIFDIENIYYIVTNMGAYSIYTFAFGMRIEKQK